VEIVKIDQIDRQIMHALGLDGRISFIRLAEILGLSDQTVARRYRRLRTRGLIRVVGLCDHRRTGGANWWVRIGCAPGTAPAIGHAMVQRPDTVWVQLLSGGTEILCGIRTSEPEPAGHLLLDKLPRTARITSLTSHLMLHMFAGGSLGDGAGLIEGLTPEQCAELVPPPPPPLAEEPYLLDDFDRALFAELGREARTSHAEVAAATGWSESAVRRRVEHLRELGVLYYDLEIDVRMLGLRTQAWLWVTVEPGMLASVGAEIATHVEVPFAAATTGPTNLVAIICLRSAEALYDYLHARLGTLPGVLRVETVPITQTLKQGGASVLM
jgi:DNA-binding Lrp family transcriptional regulator